MVFLVVNLSSLWDKISVFEYKVQPNICITPIAHVYWASFTCNMASHTCIGHLSRIIWHLTRVLGILHVYWASFTCNSASFTCNLASYTCIGHLSRGFWHLTRVIRHLSHVIRHLSRIIWHLTHVLGIFHV